METLVHLLESRAARAPDAPAILDRGRPMSYAQLADESRRVARGLAGLGVRRGDAVALWLPSLPAWLAVFFACARLGAVAVSVNTRFRSHELEDILQRSRARVLVFWPGFKGIDFAGLLAGCGAASTRALEAIVAYDEDAAAPEVAVLGKRTVAYRKLTTLEPLLKNDAEPGAGCAIFTTSGTTKAPKFVLHDQRTVVRHAADVVQGFGLGPDAVMYLAPPLCGVYGFCAAMATLHAGRPLVMAPAWDAEAAVRDIRTHRVTHANGTDDAFAQLVAHPGADFSSVRFFGYAAFNPADTDLLQRAESRGLRIAGLYGSSEIQALFARQDETLPAAERGVAGGRPVSDTARVRVRDTATGALLGPGQPGELEFLAPRSRMVEYRDNPEATRQALDAEGWFRSGDLGSTTADGRFVFLSRIGDALRLGGFLVSPAEIEDVVQGAPGIAACQVVAVPGKTGLVPVAFVLLRDGASLDERAVIAHVAARLARYKVPVRVAALDAFPVTPGANATKIQKARLREMAGALLH